MNYDTVYNMQHVYRDVYTICLSWFRNRMEVIKEKI